MIIDKIWFDEDFIYGVDSEGMKHRQSLLWYPRLKDATDSQREDFTVGIDGFHWRHIDEDISFESFFYEDAEPTALQRFFLMHREINVAEFAKRIGINAGLLRNYINGFKKPSKEREQLINDGIRSLGEEFVAARF